MSRFPQKFASILCVIVFILLLIGLLSQMAKFYLFSEYEAPERFEPLLKLVDLGKENNLPTWYSSTALFINAVFVGFIAWVKRQEDAPYAKHWLGLAGIFLFLSVDEAASIHELTSGIAVRLLERLGLMSDYFYYGWMIFAIVAVMIVGVSYLQFLIDLPTQTRLWFLFAGFLYVGGAVGLELFESKIFATEQQVTLTFALLVVVEEGMEMFGVVASIYAALSSLSREDMRISLLRLHQKAVG